MDIVARRGGAILPHDANLRRMKFSERTTAAFGKQGNIMLHAHDTAWAGRGRRGDNECRTRGAAFSAIPKSILTLTPRLPDDSPQKPIKIAYHARD
jgi:hypothetical protein